MAAIPTVVFPSGLGGAAGPLMQGPPGMGSQAEVPVTGQPQLCIPQLPYPSGSRGSRHDSGIRQAYKLAIGVKRKVGVHVIGP